MLAIKQALKWAIACSNLMQNYWPTSQAKKLNVQFHITCKFFCIGIFSQFLTLIQDNMHPFCSLFNADYEYLLIFTATMYSKNVWTNLDKRNFFQFLFQSRIYLLFHENLLGFRHIIPRWNGKWWGFLTILNMAHK